MKRGRRPTPAAKQKRLFLKVRLAEGEFDALCAAARRRESTLSAMAREAIVVVFLKRPEASGPILGANHGPQA